MNKEKGNPKKILVQKVPGIFREKLPGTLSDDQFLSDNFLEKERKKEYDRENREAKASLAIQKVQVITE